MTTNETLNVLVCPDGHEQSPLQSMVSMSFDDEFDPAVLLLPHRDWTMPYVKSRYWLQGQYLRRFRGG